MINRCYNENTKSYNDYGLRGITVSEEWRASFDTFCKWAFENGYTEDLTIDRINNDEGYSPSNCRWTDQRSQNLNKRTPKNNKSG